jgi:hypothetical protein
MAGRAIEVYLEVGAKRTFAGGLAWPGWCRSARDEASALAALAAYGSRYEAAMAGPDLAFEPPAGAEALVIVGRVAGNASTDFGVPGALAPGDQEPVAGAELERLAAVLRACWATLDGAAAEVTTAGLTAGPRGGGRSVEAIRSHVADAEAAYLSALGWKAPPDRADRRPALLEAMTAVAPLGVPPPGPRGGKRWPARYFARRVAWHALDHAWEIQDRTLR